MVGEIDRPRDVACLRVHRFDHTAVTLGGSRVDEVTSAQLLNAHHAIEVRWWGVGGLDRLDDTGLDSSALLDPFGVPAVEDLDLVVSDGVEHPPHSGRNLTVAVVVDHDMINWSDTKLTKSHTKSGRRRQWMTSRTLSATEVSVKVDEDGAGNVATLIGVSAVGRIGQGPSNVEQTH